MAECAVAAINDTWLEQFASGEESRRFHWSAAAWQQVVERSLPSLLLGLDRQTTVEARFALVSGYLTLVAEGIGLQLLYPHPAGEFPNVFSVVLERVIPTLLRTVPDVKDKADSMTKLWNLCDAVAEQPAWVEAALIESLAQLSTLQNITETCRTLQQDLLGPAPQLLSSKTTPESLSYTALSIWPLGFFLPEMVIHCGPNVFLIGGRSPGVTRMFYVLAGKRLRVLPLNGRADPGAEDTKIEAWPAKLVKIAARFQLPLLSVAAAESGVAAVFSGSQQLHLWQVRAL